MQTRNAHPGLTETKETEGTSVGPGQFLTCMNLYLQFLSQVQRWNLSVNVGPVCTAAMCNTGNLFLSSSWGCVEWLCELLPMLPERWLGLLVVGAGLGLVCVVAVMDGVFPTGGFGCVWRPADHRTGGLPDGGMPWSHTVGVSFVWERVLAVAVMYIWTAVTEECHHLCLMTAHIYWKKGGTLWK